MQGFEDRKSDAYLLESEYMSFSEILTPYNYCPKCQKPSLYIAINILIKLKRIRHYKGQIAIKGLHISHLRASQDETDIYHYNMIPGISVSIGRGY
jgi:hypothetical protein